MNVRALKFVLKAIIIEIGKPKEESIITIFVAKDIEQATEIILSIRGLLTTTRTEFNFSIIRVSKTKHQIWFDNSRKITTILEIEELNEQGKIKTT